jgi:hypothetical protein
MERIWSWLYVFGRFWYRFIIGDDWTLAATVGFGLVLTGVVNARGMVAWWLLPALVIVAVGISLRRASGA